MPELILGVEVEILCRPRPTGVERALRLWLAGLGAIGRVRTLAFSRSHPGDLPPGVEPVTCPAPLPLALWRETILPRALRRSGAAVLLSPVTAFPLRSPVPVVATLHELPWFEEGVAGPYRREAWRARLALRRADTVLAVSAAAARQAVALAFREHLPLPPIRVARHGFPLPPAGAPLTPTGERGPLVVTISADRPRKNLPVHLEAFAHAARRVPQARYVLVGPTGAGRRRLERLAAELGVGDRVDLPGYLADDRVDALLRRSAILLHTPLSEGFGFTPLEALVRGCVPLLSRRGALAEVSGEAAFYTEEPADPALTGAVLTAALADGPERQRRLTVGVERLTLRDPERATARLLAVCTETARRRRGAGRGNR